MSAPIQSTVETASDVPGAEGSQVAYIPAGSAFSTDYPTTVLAVSGITAYWRLNETSGSSATDATGNGHTGTYVNSPTLNQAGASAPGGASVLLANASSQRITAATISITNTFSVEAWYKPTTNNINNGFRAIVCKGTGTDNWFLGTNGPFVAFGPGSISVNNTSNASYSNMVAGIWYHLVGVCDNLGFYHLYVNGRLVASGSATSGNANNSGLIGIGGASGGYFLDGNVAHVAIYGVVLTDAQVTQHYQMAAESLSAMSSAGRLNRKVFTSIPAMSGSSGGVTNYAY